MTDLAVAETARSAAQWIRDHGLAKNDLMLPDGSACFNGAILIALHGDAPIPTDQLLLWRITGLTHSDDPAREIRKRILDRIDLTATEILVQEHGSLGSPVLWNNDDDRTAEEVAGLLDEVATRFSDA